MVAFSFFVFVKACPENSINIMVGQYSEHISCLYKIHQSTTTVHFQGVNTDFDVSVTSLSYGYILYISSFSISYN